MSGCRGSAGAFALAVLVIAAATGCAGAGPGLDDIARNGSPPSAVTSPDSSGTGPAPAGSALTAGATGVLAIVTDPAPGGAIDQTQAFTDFSPAFGLYALRVPAGWQQVDAESTSLFIQRYDRVRIQVTDATEAPTVASATAELARIGANALAFVAGPVVALDQHGTNPVIRVSFQDYLLPLAADEQVVLQTVQQLEFWRGGKLVTVTLSNPVGTDNSGVWRTIIASFRWL